MAIADKYPTLKETKKTAVDLPTTENDEKIKAKDINQIRNAVIDIDATSTKNNEEVTKKLNKVEDISNQNAIQTAANFKKINEVEEKVTEVEEKIILVAERDGLNTKYYLTNASTSFKILIANIRSAQGNNFMGIEAQEFKINLSNLQYKTYAQYLEEKKHPKKVKAGIKEMTIEVITYGDGDKKGQSFMVFNMADGVIATWNFEVHPDFLKMADGLTLIPYEETTTAFTYNSETNLIKFQSSIKQFKSIVIEFSITSKATPAYTYHFTTKNINISLWLANGSRNWETTPFWYDASTTEIGYIQFNSQDETTINVELWETFKKHLQSFNIVKVIGIKY